MELDMNYSKPRSSCMRKQWKKLLVVALVVGILTWVIVDSVTQNCTLVEGESDRVQRLFCIDLINTTDSLEVVEGQEFICGGDVGWTSEEDGWAPQSDLTCTKESSCLAVGFDSLLSWISDNPGVGWVVTAVVYAVLTVCLLPGSVLTIGSGIAFGTALGLGKGLVVGATAVVVGATIGASLAFLLGRFLLKSQIESWAQNYPTISAMDSVFKEKGFQLVLLLRFSPIVPFNVFNFIMGSTSVTFSEYFWGTFLGIIPGTFAFVFIGALIGSAAFTDSEESASETKVVESLCEDDPKEKTVRTVFFVVGGIATVVAVVIITYFSRKQFKKIKARLDSDESEGTNSDKEARIETNQTNPYGATDTSAITNK